MGDQDFREARDAMRAQIVKEFGLSPMVILDRGVAAAILGTGLKSGHAHAVYRVTESHQEIIEGKDTMVIDRVELESVTVEPED